MFIVPFVQNIQSQRTNGPQGCRVTNQRCLYMDSTFIKKKIILSACRTSVATRQVHHATSPVKIRVS